MMNHKKRTPQHVFLLINIWLVIIATRCTNTSRELVPTELPNLPKPSNVITVENAARLQRVANLGAGTIKKIALTPDGKTLLVANNNEVYLYDFETLEGRRLDADVHCRDLAIDPSGNHLALASQTMLLLWDISTGQILHALDSEGPLFSVAFSTDGSRLATGGEYTVRIWDVESGNLLQELHTGTEEVLTVAFSPDGTRLISGGGYNDSSYTLQLWDINTNNIIYDLDDWESHTFAAFSPDGSLVAAVSSARIKIWDTNTGMFLQEILTSGETSAQSTMDSFIFGPEGETIIGDGQPIRVWSVDGKQLNTLWSEADNILLLPDGHRIISQIESTFTIWNLSTEQIEREFTLQDHVGWINDLTFSPDSSKIVTASSDDILRIWDVETGKLKDFQKVKYDLWLVAFHPDGEILAYGGCSEHHRDGACVEGKITLWNIEKRQIMGYFSHSLLNKMAFNPNGQTIAASANAYEAAIRFYDIHSGAIKDFDQGCYTFVFSPDGNTIATYCADASSSEIHLLDAENGDLLKVFHDAYSVEAISPDGKLLAAISGESNKVQIWNLSDNSNDAPLHELETRGESVSSVAFGIDSRLLAVEVERNNKEFNPNSSWLELWDVIEGRLLLTIDTQFMVMSFSPDGKYLATGDSTGNVYLWTIQ